MLALGLGLGGYAAWYRVTRNRPAAAPALARPVPGDQQRVQVEVLNASAAVGAGRAATRRLRDAGLDVVYYGSDTAQALDSTQILVRRGDAAAGTRVQRALGAGSVRSAADAARQVDVTVRLGRDFAALARQP